MVRALERLAIVIAAGGVLAGVQGLHAQAPIENRLKAAIISKLPQFVEWPPAAALVGRTTVDICVAPPNPFGSDLRDFVVGEVLGGRRIAVRAIDREQDLETCHVLFLSAEALTAHRALLARAASLPLLTVSDDQGFLEDGGIIRLRLANGRMRFDVNAAAARQAGLRISSQLLQLALIVRGES